MGQFAFSVEGLQYSSGRFNNYFSVQYASMIQFSHFNSAKRQQPSYIARLLKEITDNLDTACTLCYLHLSRKCKN